VGGFITMSHLGWRWTQWLTLILALFFLLVYFLTVPETYAPVLLTRRAKKLRRETGNSALHTLTSERKIKVGDLGRVYVLKPWIMLIQEPILALITLYLGFIYGFLYLCFEAFPITFQEQRGWNKGVGALPFLAITVGVLVGVALIIVHTKTRVQRQMAEHGSVAPEERLVPMMLGSFLLPIGMFWFACGFVPLSHSLHYLSSLSKRWFTDQEQFKGLQIRTLPGYLRLSPAHFSAAVFCSSLCRV
jgi:MFS family permease